MALSPELDILTGVSITTWANAPILKARKIVDVTLPGAEIETFDSSDQSTSTARAKIPADVYDCGPLELVVQHKQDVDIYSEIGAVGSVVLALPNSGSSLAFEGIFKSYKPQNTPFNEPMMADVVIEVNGDITPTAGS